MRFRTPLLLIFSLMLVLSTSTANAALAWYYGTVSRIYMFNGGFVITMNGNALDDCQHRYVCFRDWDLGEKTVDRAYSLILLAEQTDRQVGVVIDKDINGPNGQCNANGSVDIRD